jgi:hypothetical protein
MRPELARELQTLLESGLRPLVHDCYLYPRITFFTDGSGHVTVLVKEERGVEPLQIAHFSTLKEGLERLEKIAHRNNEGTQRHDPIPQE